MKNKTIWIVVIVIVIVGVIIGLSKRSSVPQGSLRIGVLSALTGNVAFIGESNRRGAELGKLKAEEEHPGLVIEMFHEDHQFNPQTAITAYNKLRETNKINALSTMASNVGVAVAPIAIKDNILYIAASTLAAGYSTPNDLTFRLTSSPALGVTPILQYLESKNAKKLGVIHMTNEIGVSLRDALRKVTANSTVKIVAEEGYAADATDFRTILLKMKTAGVDSLYLASLAPHDATILQQANDLGLSSVHFVSYQAAEDPVLVKNAGILAEKLVFANAYDANNTSSGNGEFAKNFREKYGEEPNGYAAEAYEAIRLIADTYVKCGDTTVDPKAIECAKSHLFSIQGRTSLFGPLSFDQNGDVTYPFFLKTVRNGKFVRYME